MEIPAVSVIVPLYNAEKYVGDCLDSILEQTLKNFEVIVVDDCSTDSSPAIVESYAPKFDGRLTLIKTKQNSGNSGYTARNKGFSFSRGEYVWFVDADDFITKTALEELYTAAKNVDADVVYTGMRYLYSTENGAELMLDETGWALKEKGIEDKPTLAVNDRDKNIEQFFNVGVFWAPWTKFVKRDFLSKKEISFYETLSSGDHIWTMELFTSADRLLRILNAVYFWRTDSISSITREKISSDRQIIKWSEAAVSFAREATKLSKQNELLRENPKYCYRMLMKQLVIFLGRNLWDRIQVSSEYVYEILRREFENKGESDLIIPFFFSLVDSLQKDLLIAQQQQTQLPEEVKAHIADLEKRNKYMKAYVAELEKFVADSQQRIAELEAELACRLK